MNDWIAQFLEDQHPLVRMNVKMGVVVFGAMLGLQVAVWLGVQMLETRLMFRFNMALRLYHTLLLLLLVMMSYNVLKVLVQFLRGRGVFTVRGLVLSLAGVLLLLGAIGGMPSVLNASVAHVTGRSFGAVYADFDALCQRWDAEWGGAEISALDLEQEDLGRLGTEADVFKVRDTIIFNFGQPGQAFGLACVLRGQQPEAVGRTNNYTFRQIQPSQYEFVQELAP